MPRSPRTLQELAHARDASPGGATETEARREIAACEVKLRQHKAALEAEADAVIVTG